MSKDPLITTELLDTLAGSIEIKSVTSQQEFEAMLKLEYSIVYILVNWSGPERLSRYYVFKALSE